jgi:hypothetical protein
MYHVDTGSYPGALTTLTSDANYFPDGAPSCPFSVAYTMDGTTHRISTSGHSH